MFAAATDAQNPLAGYLPPPPLSLSHSLICREPCQGPLGRGWAVSIPPYSFKLYPRPVPGVTHWSSVVGLGAGIFTLTLPIRHPVSRRCQVTRALASGPGPVFVHLTLPVHSAPRCRYRMARAAPPAAAAAAACAGGAVYATRKGNGRSGSSLPPQIRSPPHRIFAPPRRRGTACAWIGRALAQGEETSGHVSRKFPRPASRRRSKRAT